MEKKEEGDTSSLYDADEVILDVSQQPSDSVVQAVERNTQFNTSEKNLDNKDIGKKLFKKLVSQQYTLCVYYLMLCMPCM